MSIIDLQNSWLVMSNCFGVDRQLAVTNFKKSFIFFIKPIDGMKEILYNIDTS